MNSILQRVANDPPSPGHRIRMARLDGVVSMELTELWESAGRVAHGLRRLGVGRGDRIGILAANSLQWVLLDLAALRLGTVVAGLEPGKFQLDQSLLARYDLAVVFTDRTVDVPGVHAISEVDQFAAETGRVDELPPIAWSNADPIALKFTSGSTGTPKCLAASAASVNSSISGVQGLFTHGPGDDLFVFLPLSLLQQRYWIYSALAFGHDVTISTYEAAFVTMRRTQPTVVMGVPAFFEAARTHLERQVDRVPGPGSRQFRIEAAARELFGGRVRYLWTGSAPAAPAMLEFFESCGMPIYEGYGLNETCIVTKNAPGGERRGSVGRVLPGKRVRIGADGVISVDSDFPVAIRYEDAPTGDCARVFTEHGVRTGDLGYLDDDGYLFLVGRADDVIVLGNGRKVIVRPLEEFMRQSPAVAECVLFCPTQSQIVAVVSPTELPPDCRAIEIQLALCNATFGADEQIRRVVVAPEPFTVDNGLCTAQRKPRRNKIQQTYHTAITDPRKGSHVFCP